MKQVEVTVRVKEKIETAITKLEQQGFKMIRESNMHDIYMTQLKEQLNRDNIQFILTNSILLRYLKTNTDEIKKITYKNKEYKNGEVLTEQKINVECDSIEAAYRLFKCLKYEELVEVKSHILVMKRDDIELAFQDVEKLGVFIEYENNNDFEGKTIEEIKEEKEKMYNTVKDLGIEITEKRDIKKAWELIEKQLL